MCCSLHRYFCLNTRLSCLLSLTSSALQKLISKSLSISLIKCIWLQVEWSSYCLSTLIQFMTYSIGLNSFCGSYSMARKLDLYRFIVCLLLVWLITTPSEILICLCLNTKSSLIELSSNPTALMSWLIMFVSSRFFFVNLFCRRKYCLFSFDIVF